MHVCIQTILMSAKCAISSHVGKHERKYTYSKPQNTVAEKYKFALGFFLFETNLIFHNVLVCFLVCCDKDNDQKATWRVKSLFHLIAYNPI